jgi:hypothetical protein
MIESSGRKPHGEHWKTIIGVIFVVAGSAIRLDNFLGFSCLCAQHGGEHGKNVQNLSILHDKRADKTPNTTRART